MFTFLKNHPFPVEAYFKASIVLTFALPKEAVSGLIPECLRLDCLKDSNGVEKWAFIAVALVQTKDLRPKGFPKMLGNDFFLVGYRVFVTYESNSGRRLRGLYILRSETDRKKMEIMGNIFTHYNYTTTDIKLVSSSSYTEVRSTASSLYIMIDKANGMPALPVSSPFADWKQARRFAGPLPFSFTYDEATGQVVIIEGVRNNWHPRPVMVLDYHLSFFESMHIKDPVLASAFIVENIPYYWKKGKKEIWKRKENPSRA